MAPDGSAFRPKFGPPPAYERPPSSRWRPDGASPSPSTEPRPSPPPPAGVRPRRGGRAPRMDRASPEELRYFQRIAAANAGLDGAAPPASLAETLDRLEDMARRLGALGRAGAGCPPHHGDLDSHLACLARLRAIDPSYRTRRDRHDSADGDRSVDLRRAGTAACPRGRRRGRRPRSAAVPRNSPVLPCGNRPAPEEPDR